MFENIGKDILPVVDKQIQLVGDLLNNLVGQMITARDMGDLYLHARLGKELASYECRMEELQKCRKTLLSL